MPDFGTNTARMQEFSALLEIGLSEVFEADLKGHGKLFPAWIKTMGADEFVEDKLVISGFGVMGDKGIGGRITTQKPFISDPKDFTLLTFGIGFVAEYELIRWDKYSIFGDMTKQLRRSGTERQNISVYAILNNSFSTADATYTTYAGEALCSATHALMRGGTGKNHPTVAAGLAFLSLQEALTDFGLQKNEDGLFSVLTPSMVITAVKNKWWIRTLLGTKTRPDRPHNEINTVAQDLDSYHCAPFITLEEAFWVMCDKAQLKLSYDVGDDLRIRRDFEIATWNNAVNCYGSWRVCVLHWFGMWGSPGQ